MIEDDSNRTVTFEGTSHSTASVPEIITTTQNTSRLIFTHCK
jgi:hypothetical protein